MSGQVAGRESGGGEGGRGRGRRDGGSEGKGRGGSRAPWTKRLAACSSRRWCTAQCEAVGLRLRPHKP